MDYEIVELVESKKEELLKNGYVSKVDNCTLSKKGIELLLEYLKDKKIDISNYQLAKLLGVKSSFLNAINIPEELESFEYFNEIVSMKNELLELGYVSKNDKNKLSLQGVRILVERLKEKNIEIPCYKLAKILKMDYSLVQKVKL